jgi:WD40 repeat protein
MPSTAFDAFISYSHVRDAKLAAALKQGLHGFARPWYRLRALHVFLDNTNLAANPDLWTSIEEALGRSRHFVLLASPAAAASPWVAKEVDQWRETRAADRLVLVLTDGELRWDAEANDFDWSASDAAPRALSGAFAAEPRWIDLRFGRDLEEPSARDPQFRDALADVAAPMHGKTKEELVGEDVRQHRRTVRIVRATVVVLLALVAAAGTAALIAVRQRDRAEREARIALARQLAAQSRVSLNENRPDLALLLAAQASRTNSTGESRDSLLAALNSEPQLVRVATTPPARLAAAAADGRSMVLLGRDGVLRRVAAGSGRVGPRARGGQASATGLAASGDGRLVAVGGAGGALAVVDLHDRRRTVLVRGSPEAGATVASSNVNHPVFAARRQVLVWDAGQKVGVWTGGEPRLLDAPYSPEDVPWKPAVSPDGRRVAAVGGETALIVVWRVGPDGRQLGAPRVLPQQAGVEGLGPRDVITGLAFSSADDTVLAVSRSDGAVALVDVDSGQTLRLLRGGRGRVEHMAFSPDGERLVAAHENGVDAWDVATGRRLAGHASTFSSDLAVGMTRGGETATAAGSEGTVALIDVREPRHRLARALRLPVTGEAVDTVSASPDGRALVASPFLGEQAQLLGSGAAAARALSSHDATTFLHFSEDGRRLLVCCGAGFDSVLKVKDLQGKTLESFTDDGSHALADAALTRSGRLLVLGHDGNQSSVWDARRPKAARRLAGTGDGEPVLLSADGRLAAVVVKGETGIWATRDGRRRGAMTVGRPQAFSEDGSRLAVTSPQEAPGVARVLDTATGRPLAAAMETRQPILSGALSPDGRTLALLTASASLTAPSKTYAVELWDAERGTRLGAEDLVSWTVPERDVRLPSVAFRTTSSGNADVVVGGVEKRPLEWTLDLDAWSRVACAVVRRDFTRAEWDRYVGGVEDYEPTCTRP